MFKGFIQGKRVTSTDFSSARDDGKENRAPLGTFANADTMKNLGKTDVGNSNEMVHAFDRLLDDLQIPPSLRPKLNDMEPSVKAAMLRSSHTLALAPSPVSPSSPSKRTPTKPNTLRKTRSSDSIGSPRPPVPPFVTEFPPPLQTTGRFLGAAMKSTSSLAYFSDDITTNSAPQSIFSSPARHSRGVSLDIAHNVATHDHSGSLKAAKDKTGKDMSPAKYCNLLVTASSLHLDIEAVKKLRLLLRNESASWTETFLELGGYAGLLTRLNELLEIEWREEQHDDQLLHELLRCFKALSTSAIGCAALRSASPAPYSALIRLLYSDKKPGEVSTRQLIAELLLILLDIYPTSISTASPAAVSSQQVVGLAFSCDNMRDVDLQSVSNDTWSSERGSAHTVAFPHPHRNLFTFLRSLLLTPAPPPSEGRVSDIDHHDFISSLHTPRIYKTYIQVLLDICRDYFWVFCHSSNTIWNLDDTDETRVEKPRAPGGMTGGVEFEAMGYLITHLKLLNAMAKLAADNNSGVSKEHEFSSHRFHSDLFASGIERVLLVIRKASTTYYPTLHLEIARYVRFAIEAHYELPWTLSRTVGPPPSGMAKSGRIARERERSNRNSTNTTSSARSGGPRRAAGGRTTPAPGAPGRGKVA